MGRSFQALVQQGRVYLPKGKAWVEPLLNQLTRFPFGAFDDGADVLALFGRRIDKVWSKTIIKEKKKKVEVKGMPQPTMAEMTGMTGDNDDY